MLLEEYKNTILSLVKENEDVKRLIGLFHLMDGCTTEKALVKNFNALTGKDCKDLLKLLIMKQILKVGAHDAYLCLSGYEDIFNVLAAEYSPQPGDLLACFEKAVEEEDKATLKALYLLLNLGRHGLLGSTQYEILKTDISEIFTPAVFQSVEERLIRDRICVYGEKYETEFLDLYQSDAKKSELKERMWAWKAKELADRPVKKQLEKEIGELVRGARERMKGRGLADTLGIPESETVEETSGYFSGFEMDDSFLFLTSDLLLEHDTEHIVIVDSYLSRFEVLEWKNFPVVFVTDAMPRWLGKTGAVFKAAYPKLSDRKIAIAVPNKGAYSNFKQRLLYLLLDRLEVEELSELQG
ncbi:MAG: hypothetical protein U9O90_10650 [Euryarchaeota archaeon]|nr:hypothetical protein [Euryarchaeota archaeon]